MSWVCVVFSGWHAYQLQKMHIVQDKYSGDDYLTAMQLVN